MSELTQVDDVQRAEWALSGLCPGCGCKKSSWPLIHLRDCEYETNGQWREDLTEYLTNATRNLPSSLDLDNTPTYMGEKLDKETFFQMIKQILYSRN